MKQQRCLVKRHYISQSKCQRSFGRANDPAAIIESGDEVTFETTDNAYQRLASGESPDEIPDEDYNVVTGPVAVVGAEPGDSLSIDILDIAIRRAWAIWLPDYGPLGEMTDRVQAQRLSIADGFVSLSDRLKVPLSPMIGCIGLAPATGTASTLEPAYPFGGNLDLRELSQGATLILPVQASNAWLSLGDLHAAMGTGEPAFISIEAAGEATVRVTLLKQMAMAGPRLLLAGRTLCVAVLDENGTLEQAARLATQQAFELLTTEFALTPFEAYSYLSARVDLRFGGPASSIVIADVPHPFGSVVQTR